MPVPQQLPQPAQGWQWEHDERFPDTRITEINLWEPWDLTRIFELVELVNNGTYKQDFPFCQRRGRSEDMSGKHMATPRSIEKKERDEVLQVLLPRFLCKLW